MKSEFTMLEDMVISRGVAHSVLIAEVKEAVLEKFRQRYPKQPIGVAAVIDESSGEVRIFNGDKDVTPDEFREEAKSTARLVLIGYLDEQTVRRVNISIPRVQMNSYPVWSWIINLLFWGYNGYFLLVAISAAGQWWTGLFNKAGFWINLANANLAEVMAVLLMLVTPVMAILITLKRNQLGKPIGKGKVFFGGEIPVLAIAWLLAGVGDHTTIFIQFFILTLLAIPASLFFYMSNSDLGKMGQRVVLFIQATAFMAVGYITLLFSFFVPGIISSISKSLLDNIFYSPELLVMSPLTLGLILLLIAIPYLTLYILAKALNKTARVVKDQRLQLAFAVVILAIGTLAAWQPRDYKLLDVLAKMNQTYTFAEQEQLVKQIYNKETEIAKRITTLQKDRYIYLFDKDSYTGLDSWTNKVFLKLAYPLVFQGGDYSQYQLENNFKYVFGHYVSETTPYTPKSAQNVKLAYRKYSLTTNTNGLAGKVSVEEEFENSTNQQQEVIYEFSLPEGSVITELNLGPNLEYPGVIAPKGAAQKTYQAQLQVRRDPALLEQIGPNWYRLRIFPIPGMNDFNTLKGKRQKVQWSYVTPTNSAGWSKPNFYKTANLIIGSGTTILEQRNNGVTSLSYKDSDYFSKSMESDYGTRSPSCYEYQTKNIIWPSGAAKITTGGCPNESNVLNNIRGQNIAVLLDISTENKNTTVLNNLRELDKIFFDNNNVYLYKYNQYLSLPTKLTGKNVNQMTENIFFGDKGNISLWNNINMNYDVLLISAAPKTDLTKNSWFSFKPDKPIYFITNMEMPALSNKLTAAVWQSGGGNKTSIKEALNDSSTSKAFKIQITSPDKIADYLALVAKPASNSADIDKAIVNGALLKMYLKNKYTDVTGNIDEMDKLNKFAQTAGIVTPFSSYIALVNEAQKQQLQNFSDSYNRYQEQAMVQNNQNNSINLTLPSRSFEGSAASSGIFGAPLLQMDLSPSNTSGGGGGNMGKIANPSMGASQFQSVNSFGFGSVFGGSTFILLNMGVLGIGLVVYLIRLTKSSHKT